MQLKNVCTMILSTIFIVLLFNLQARAGDIYTLDSAIQEAIHNNYLIQTTMDQIRAAQAQRRAATAGMLPELSFDYSAIGLKNQPYLKIPHRPLPVFSGGKPNGESVYLPPRMYMNGTALINWEIELKQPIFTGFALFNERKLAELGIDLTKVEREEAILNIEEEVKIAYFNVLRAQKQLQVAKERVEELSAHEHDAKHFYDRGIVAYNDLLKSQVALADAVQFKAQAEANLNIARANFNTILNRDLNKDVELEDITSVTPASYDLASLTNEALQERPELKALGIKVKQADTRVKLAESEYYPHVFAFAAYTQAGQDGLAARNEYQNQYNQMVGIGIKWTIFNWLKTTDNTQQADYMKSAIKNQLNLFIDAVKLQVKSALIELDTAAQDISTSETALAQAKENYRITNIQYNQQLVTSTEVLDAQTYLTQAELNYYNALYGYEINLAKLERSIGRSSYGK
ncbi:MAG: TolC family protein [bacterium]